MRVALRVVKRAEPRHQDRWLRGSRLALKFVVVAAVAACLGCATAPEWIDAPPRVDGYLYATGSFVGSLYPEDNRRNALEDAVTSLSRQIESQVRENTVVHSDDHSSNIQRRAQVTTEQAIENWELVSSWRDDDGLRGPRGTEWVLIRTPLGAN